MIINFEDRFSGEKKSYEIHSMTDFKELIQAYPEIRGVIFDKDSLEEAVEAAAKALASRNFKVSLEGENVFEHSKIISKALKTLGIAAMLTFPACIQKAEPPRLDIIKYRPYGYKPEDRFLQAIEQLESTGGLNTNHKDPDTIGRFGLRIPTIRDVVRRFDINNADLAAVVSISPDELKKLFKKYPELELHVARLLARHLISKFGSDIGRAAFSWRWGHNLHKADITDEKLADAEYVRKFYAIMAKDKLKKSEHDFLTKFKFWLDKRKKMKEENLVQPEPDLSVPREDDKSEFEGDLAELKEAIKRAKE